MDGFDSAMHMAQAALGVKNRAIDRLAEENAGLKRENDDLYKILVQGAKDHRFQITSSPAAHNADGSSTATSSTSLLEAPTSLEAKLQDAKARIVVLQAEAAQAVELRQQLRESKARETAAQTAHGAEVQTLRAELVRSREHISALEAELQDTMEAAMQLWETVQMGAWSEGATSRAGSLYQEQLSPLGAPDGDEASLSPSPALAHSPRSRQLTPRGAHTPADSVSPAAAALGGGTAAAPAAATNGTQPDSTSLADLAIKGSRDKSPAPCRPSPQQSSINNSDQTAAGLFTPIEARVTSLTNRLRGYMMRQPGLSQSPSPPPQAAGSPGDSGPAADSLRGAGVKASPSRAGSAMAAAAAGGVVSAGGADVAAARDVN